MSYKPLLLLLALLAADALPAAPKGHLVIIGGGKRPKEIMLRFVELAGGSSARIVVIPNASGVPDTSGMEMMEEFRSYGVASAKWILLDRGATMDEKQAELLDGATGIYFTGGDQSRLTKALAGTPVHRKLLILYDAGAVIGGTSAGAAVMSSIMITGEELINKDTVNAFISITKSNIETVEGFGFMKNAIVDQHFVRRKRHNRLLSVVLEYPSLPGIGIDEATAIIVRPDNTFDVMGNGSVIVFDARKAHGIRADARGNLGGSAILTSVLLDGDRYNIITGNVTRRP